MGMFDNVSTAADVTAEPDRVRGAKREPLASDIYDLNIKLAYVTKAKSGAVGVNLVLVTGDNKEIRVQEWVTSGDAKGNKTFYEADKKDANGNITGKEKKSLPGFLIIDALCQLVAGKSILKCDQEKKIVNLYNFEHKKEMPTEVEMLMDLVGKKVAATVLHQIQDKTAKNLQTGEYEPTGKVFGTNVIDKFLDPDTHKTHSEVKNNIDSAYAGQWLAKWKGQIDDQSTEVKGAGLKGAPVASGDAAPKTSLFG
jgi:hypothetical protein